jgi:carbamoyl-phosphate synthase large subunit
MGNKINVLMTGAGAPGGPGIFKALDLEKNFNVFLCDMNINASGRFLSPEKFTQIPAAGKEEFIPKILELCDVLNIDVVFPLVTKELFKLSQAKRKFAEQGVKIIVSDWSSLHIANDKGKLYQHLADRNIRVPAFRLVNCPQSLREACEHLGYPERPVVIKPAIGNGSRGVRILDESRDRFDLLFNSKPSALYSNLEDVVSVIGKRDLPKIMVSEYLPGPEITIDTLVENGVIKTSLLRTRDAMNNGISTSGRFVDDVTIADYIENIVDSLPGLSGPIGFQVKESIDGEYLLLESNPRIQGTSVAALGLGINLPVQAVSLALGYNISKNNTKSGIGFSRYYSEVFYDL